VATITFDDPVEVATKLFGEVASNVFADGQGLPTTRGRIVPSGVIAQDTLTHVEHRQIPLRSTDFADAMELGAAGTYPFFWFECFHVIPRSFDFGNLLSSQSIPMEVYSAFRQDPAGWTSFVNGAGAGVELSGAPSLPATADPQTGYTMTLDVDANGEAFVDATLDFVFDHGTALVAIVIQRIVLWGAVPELPYTELARSKTDVIRSSNGKEQRAKWRKNPRQAFVYDYVLEEGIERQTLENLLFDFQARLFGVPVWFDDAVLTVAAVVTDTSVTVEDTAFRDFRVDGLAVVFTEQATFDVLKVTAITATTITFDSPLLNSYGVGTEVFPLATCRARPTIQGRRLPVGLSKWGIEFAPTNNDDDKADATPFSTYNGLVFLDEDNSLRTGTLSEAYQREFISIDNGSGIEFVDSPWDNSRRGHLFTLRAQGRQAVWELRGLVHYLAGRFTSFYVPRHSDDLVAVADLLIASNTVDVQSVGYATFVRNRQPRNVIRITEADGTTHLREVTGSVATSTTVDTLTVDTNWAATIAFGDVVRIEFIEKVRIDTDDVRMKFDPSGHRAYLEAPVVGLFE
tara:strand:- start:13849 stop:15567 length:1719 start_codon:yes stop_codon:yes gene_type:complete